MKRVFVLQVYYMECGEKRKVMCKAVIVGETQMTIKSLFSSICNV